MHYCSVKAYCPELSFVYGSNTSIHFTSGSTHSGTRPNGERVVGQRAGGNEVRLSEREKTLISG